MIKNKHTPEQSHSTIKRVLRQTFSNRLSYYNEEQIDAGCSDRASEICKAAESLGIVLGDVSELTKQRDELLAALNGLLKAHRITFSRRLPETVEQAEKQLDAIRSAVTTAETAIDSVKEMK